MSLKGHPDYKEEVITTLENNKETYKENIKDAFINLDYLDSSQSCISILTNTKFLELDSSHLEGLKRSKKALFLPDRLQCGK